MKYTTFGIMQPMSNKPSRHLGMMKVKQVAGFALIGLLALTVVYIIFADFSDDPEDISDEENFNELINTDNAFVYFYSKQNDKMNQVWNDVSDTVKKDYEDVNVAKFDCSVFRPICEGMGVLSYPSVVWMHSGRISEKFEESFDEELLKTFVFDMMNNDDEFIEVDDDINIDNIDQQSSGEHVLNDDPRVALGSEETPKSVEGEAIQDKDLQSEMPKSVVPEPNLPDPKDNVEEAPQSTMAVEKAFDARKPVLKVPESVKPVEKDPETIKPVLKVPESVKPVEKDPETIKPVLKVPVSVKPVEKEPESIKPVLKVHESVKPVEKDPESIKPVLKVPELIKPVEKVSESFKPAEKVPELVKPVEKKVSKPILKPASSESEESSDSKIVHVNSSESQEDDSSDSLSNEDMSSDSKVLRQLKKILNQLPSISNSTKVQDLKKPENEPVLDKTPKSKILEVSGVAPEGIKKNRTMLFDHKSVISEATFKNGTIPDKTPKSKILEVLGVAPDGIRKNNTKTVTFEPTLKNETVLDKTPKSKILEVLGVSTDKVANSTMVHSDAKAFLETFKNETVAEENPKKKVLEVMKASTVEAVIEDALEKKAFIEKKALIEKKTYKDGISTKSSESSSDEDLLGQIDSKQVKIPVRPKAKSSSEESKSMDIGKIIEAMPAISKSEETKDKSNSSSDELEKIESLEVSDDSESDEKSEISSESAPAKGPKLLDIAGMIKDAKDDYFVDFTAKNFDNKMNSDGVTLIMMYAEWCSECDEIRKTLIKLAHKHKKNQHITIGQIDCENPKNLDFCQTQSMQGVPTINVYSNGLIVNNNYVGHTFEELDECVVTHLTEEGIQKWADKYMGPRRPKVATTEKLAVVVTGKGKPKRN